MSDAIQTYQAYQVSGGVGLARMGCQLAEKRTIGEFGYINFEDGGVPASRQSASDYPTWYPASAEYYRIIDRISRGEKP